MGVLADSIYMGHASMSTQPPYEVVEVKTSGSVPSTPLELQQPSLTHPLPDTDVLGRVGSRASRIVMASPHTRDLVQAVTVLLHWALFSKRLTEHKLWVETKPRFTCQSLNLVRRDVINNICYECTLFTQGRKTHEYKHQKSWLQILIYCKWGAWNIHGTTKV